MSGQGAAPLGPATDFETVWKYLRAFDGEMCRKVQEPTYDGPEFVALSRIKREHERLRERIKQADMALGYIEQDAINRLTEDSPMLLIDVRKLDAVIALLRGEALGALDAGVSSE